MYRPKTIEEIRLYKYQSGRLAVRYLSVCPQLSHLSRTLTTFVYQWYVSYEHMPVAITLAIV